MATKYDEYDTGSASKLGFYAFVALILFGLVTLWLGVYYVDTGYVGILKRNGRVIDVMDPGMHVKIPYVDSVVDIETRNRGTHLELDVASKDPMMLPIKATVNWIAKRDKIVQLYNDYGSLEQFEERVIIPAFNAGIKDATAQFATADLIKDRNSLGEKALQFVKAKVPGDVVQITELYIVNVAYPEKYTNQILNTQVAQQKATEEEYITKQQNFIAKRSTQTAEANRDAVKANADGKAYEIRVQGQAAADAISMKAKALAQNPLLVDYEKVLHWNGSFPATFMGGDTGVNMLWQLPGKREGTAVQKAAE